MEAQFTCTRCFTILSIPAADLGKRVVCPACSASFIVEDGAGLTNGNSQRVEVSKPTPRPSRPERPPRPKPREAEAAQTVPRPSGCAGLLGFAGVFAAIIVTIVVYSVHRVSNRQWHQFQGPGFRVDFPRPPAENTEMLPEGRQTIIALTFHERTWLVSWLEVPNKGGDDDLAKKWLDWAETRLKENGTANPARTIALKNHPGRELFVDRPAENTRARIYFANNRLYQVSVSGPRVIRGDRYTDRFFASFRIEP